MANKLRLVTWRWTYCLVVVCIGVPTGWVWAREGKTIREHAPTPHLVCSQPHYDFGLRLNIETVEHTFVIENDGDDELVFGKTQTTCGCTIANMSRDHLQPGEKAFVAVVLSLAGREGRVQKSITLVSNDPTHNEFILTMAGKAMPPLTLEPQSIHFHLAQPNSELERTVDLIANEKRSFNILDLGNKQPWVSTTYETVDGGVFYRIHVKLTPPLPKGVLRDTIVIKTDSNQFSELSIPITVNIPGPISVTPNQIVLSQASDQPLVRYVLLSATGDDPFAIESIIVPDGSQITAEVKPLGNRGYRVRLANVQSDQKLNGTNIVISTNMTDMKTIELPIEVRAR